MKFRACKNYGKGFLFKFTRLLPEFLVHETKANASQLTEFFCSSVAPITDFEASHLVLEEFFRS